MTFNKLSEKQKKVFKWCYTTDYKAIICDGAVRSGKTICMVTSFILWAMRNFNGATFGICGKTVASAERNIIRPLQVIVDINHYYKVTYRRSSHMLTVENKTHKNYFFIFGGKDESSYTLLQGITLSGIFFDEVALMPENFVNQGIARCLSVPDSRYWFNCNPESPAHWFYKRWILNAEEQNALHLHFLMYDNPILTEREIKEAEKRFSGVFYDRYIQGLWSVAEGLVYPMYKDALCKSPDSYAEKYMMSIDYGTQNAFAAILWGLYNGVWIAVDCYYYSGREKGIQKTDDEYGRDLEAFFENNLPATYPKIKTIIDPSAASFIALLAKSRHFKPLRANNDVLDGIRETATAMQLGKIKISENLLPIIKEFEGYVWDDKSGDDKPVKVNDHCLTGDTMVMTEHGEKPISELTGTSGKIWSYNLTTCKPELKQYSDCRITQKQAKIYKIELENGKFIRCTAEHPILTKRGYVQAKDLNEHDEIIEVTVS